MSENARSMKLDASEKVLAAASVTMNFISKRKIKAAILAYSRLDTAECPGFVNFLVGRKIITPHDIKLLKEYPNKKILRCPACPQEFNVTSIEVGLQFECPSCASLITVPLEDQNFDLFSEKKQPLALSPPSFTPQSFSPPSTLASLKTEEITLELAKQGYQIIRQIGKGGMGIVYLANEVKLGRKIAVKVLLAGAFASESQVARFEREARAVAALKHPNIVSILSLGQFRGQKYFTMDFIDGMSLDVAMSRRTFKHSETVNLCSDIANAVHYAHNVGIIHRDIKPANILLDNIGKPYITDFGLAKLEDKSKSLTESGIALGTPHYMSPEQASGEIDAVHRESDVYSIGVVLYELLCGEVPHDAKTTVDIMLKVMHDDPLPPSYHKKGIPPELEAICMKAIAKRPEDRYESALSLAADLDSFLSGHTVMAKPPGIIKKSFKLAHKLRGLFLVLFLVATTVFATFYFADFFSKEVSNDELMVRSLLEAEVLVDDGNFSKVAEILASSASLKTSRVLSGRTTLRKHFLKKLLSRYNNSFDQDRRTVKLPEYFPRGEEVTVHAYKALHLNDLLEYFPEAERTLTLTNYFISGVSKELSSKYEDPEEGPSRAGSFLLGILGILGRNSNILDSVKKDFSETLSRDYELQINHGDNIEEAIERLQVLALLYPTEKKYSRIITQLRADQFSNFIGKISSFTDIIGYGSLEVRGTLENCMVEISLLTKNLGELNMDTRISKSIQLMNGLYKLRFIRKGFRVLEKNIAIEARKDVVVTIQDDEWVVQE